MYAQARWLAPDAAADSERGRSCREDRNSVSLSKISSMAARIVRPPVRNLSHRASLRAFSRSSGTQGLAKQGEVPVQFGPRQRLGTVVMNGVM